MNTHSGGTNDAGSFKLDARLSQDCMQVMDLPLCRLLLMKDAQYPWFILVPRRHGVRELYELSRADGQQLQHESNLLGRTVMRIFEGHKLNVAALGNVVAQLHIHHVVRFTDDVAWPGPVWGTHRAQAYTEGNAEQRCQQVCEALQGQQLVVSDFGQNLS